MQIHELNTYQGAIDSSAFLAVDNGTDTGKVSSAVLLKDVNESVEQLGTDLNARIDNIIAGGTAPSEAEVTDARQGAAVLGGHTYNSLGAAIRGQVTELDNNINAITDIETLSNLTVYNGYFEVGTFAIVSASYTRMVYAPIDGSTSVKATVTKAAGKLFRVGFSVDVPNAPGVQIINEAGTYIDAGTATTATVNVPDTAKYIVAVIWNQNTDASSISAQDMIDSVTIAVNGGAADLEARAQISAFENELDNIPPQNITAITRTGWNLINSKLEEHVGYYWNGSTIGATIGVAANAAYTAVLMPAENVVYNVYGDRFVHLLDEDKKLLAVFTTDAVTPIDNTSIQAAYIAVTFHNSLYANAYVSKVGDQTYTQYTVNDQWVFNDLVIGGSSNKHIYLPSKVYCAVGRTIELYNEQVFLECDKYHLHWTCNKGVSFARKFSVTGLLADVGSYALTLQVYDDNYNVVATKTSTLIISEQNIANTLKVLPIGDSLTNGKEWLSEVPTLSNNKIEYIGTRKLNNRSSEGRSGASSSWYVANSSYTYQDGSTYEGNPGVDGKSNPFWDGNAFSLAHYISTQGSYVGTPDAVQFLLGTNDLKQTVTVVANLKTMIDKIHSEYPNMKVFLCNTIFHSNQNGYHSTGGQGYIGVMTNWQYELDIYTIALMEADRKSVV